MQSVSAAWTAEEKDTSRRIASNLQTSWHKQINLANRTFTIGVSKIGQNDVIGINSDAIGGPTVYNYFDESQYLTYMAWERGLSVPAGGSYKGMAEAKLDNTSGRFTPRYMGGRSELFTAILPRRPVILGAGFNLNGIDQTIPQFSGILNKTPAVSIRDGSVDLQAFDYLDFFENRFLDQNIMFTAQRTDQVLATLFAQQGMSTAQYDLDYGINIIPFGLFPTGTKFSDAIQQLVQAENGQFYQDEQGIFKFENRQHWDSAPYNAVQRVLTTAQVIDAQAPNEDHIINVVEVTGTPREKQPNQLVWQASGFAGSGTLAMDPLSDVTVWASFDDPLLSIDTPIMNGALNQTSFYVANTQADGQGNDITPSVSLKSVSKFSTAMQLIFTNNTSSPAFLTNIDIWGRPARRTGDVYYRSSRGLSVTAYEEQSLQIASDFIQSQSWAETYGEMIIKDFAFPESLQTLTIKAIPELQLGDLISWQGHYWRVFHIRTTLDPGDGFIQEIQLLQRNIVTYFRIGISAIGGKDMISPQFLSTEVVNGIYKIWLIKYEP